MKIIVFKSNFYWNMFPGSIYQYASIASDNGEPKVALFSYAYMHHSMS